MTIQIERGVEKATPHDDVTQAILGMTDGESFFVPDDPQNPNKVVGKDARGRVMEDVDQTGWQFEGRTGVNLCRFIEEKGRAVGVTVTCVPEVKDGVNGVRCFK